VAALPSTLHTALSIAATETAKWVVRGRNEDLEGCVVAVNTISLEKRRHMLVRRPQCEHCGDPTAFASGQAAPIALQSRKKMFTIDGGHRTLSPEETLKKLEHHISPITGIVHTLQPTTPWMEEHSLVLSYVTGHNFIHASKDYTWDMDFLQATLRDASAGKGRHSTQAKASALCEAIERYSGVFQGDEARIRARLKDFGGAAIHPRDCMLFSETQLKDREAWNAVGSPSSWVPEPFEDTQEIEWSPVWSLTHGEPRYVPTAYCYYGYSRKHHSWFARADSNGCAAGHSKEEAILQGFMELIERDCVALWWYNRLQKPAIDLSSFSEPYFQELQVFYQALHRDLWVLDITNDFNIPTFAAISCRNDKEVEDILLGFGTHFDPYIALLRALTEVNQLLPAVPSCSPVQDGQYLVPDPEAISWWKTATRGNQPYLMPDETLAPKKQRDYLRQWTDDLYVDVMTCVEIAAQKGLETLVLDQTRPDIGLHVVKVIVPGLRHFWPRFARGRLYEIPVQMGWRVQPLTEDQLNPRHFFF
jgi:oxazoline/thiazoline synthase